MSCKGILPQTRNGSGQIEDESKKKFQEPSCFRKNGELSSASPSFILRESNQDVPEDTNNGANITTSVLEIASSNFVLPSNAEITSDTVGVSVDEWFKHWNDTSMDLDSVLTSGSFEAHDLEGYRFLASKDNVDMCIVTNICDMGLGFDLPVSVCDKHSEPGSECDSNEKIMNDFEQTSLLDDLAGNDILEKNILVKSASSELTDKCHLLDLKQEVPGYDLESQDEGTNEISKGAEWGESEDVYELPVVLTDKNKMGWETLSLNSRQGSDLESEKEVDFPELSLLTFQVDPNDAVNVAVNSQIDVSDENYGSENISEKCVISNVSTCVKSENLSEDEHLEVCKSRQAAVQKLRVNSKGNRGNCVTGLGVKEGKAEPRILRHTAHAGNKFDKHNNKVPHSRKGNAKSVSHPRSLLRHKGGSSKNVIEPDSLVKKVSETCNITPTISSEQDSNHKSKKVPAAMTIIAISTDKSKNTTEIVINTSQGEQKFKGKTTDFIKASSGLLSSQAIKAKIEQSLNLPSCESAQEGDSIASASASEGDDSWLKSDKSKAADEQPITEALAALGIDAATLAQGQVSAGAAGYKLWACPTPDCTKLYPRLSLLKVHILTHYGVRPYRCDVAGCHWTFYTYFKLKRHKETHLKRKAFVCPVPSCGHRFTTIYNLKTHRKLHERPARLQCPVDGCDALFQTKRAVELHVKKHGISHAPYQCTFEGCGKRYYSSNTLNSHARSHQHREDEVRCQWPGCGKWFDKPCRLKAHLRMHTGDKPYPCTFQDCRWAFSSASKLKRHQQKHTNERRFRCIVEGCGKSFMRSEHLKEHTQTHIGERSYQCTVENCGVKFTAKSSLYVHLKKHKQQQQQQQQQQQLQQQQLQQQQQQQQPPPLLARPTEPAPERSQQRGQVRAAAQLPGSLGEVVAPSTLTIYPCPVEACPKSYSCKASLRQHLLKYHTLVLASDASELDYLPALLATGSGQSTGAGMQVVGRAAVGQQTAEIIAVAAAPQPLPGTAPEGLVDTAMQPPTNLFEPDSAPGMESEYINTDLLSAPHLNNLLVVAHPDGVQEETGGALLLPTSELMRQATPSDPEAELQLSMEHMVDPLLVGGNTRTWPVAMVTELAEAPDVSAANCSVPDDPTCRAARTSISYADFRNVRPSDRKAAAPNKGVPAAVSAATSTAVTGVDAGAGAPISGLRNPVTALRLPPDMAGILAPASSELGLLLQEDSGLQVLLLDGAENQAFSESTINLRDLE